MNNLKDHCQRLLLNYILKYINEIFWYEKQNPKRRFGKGGGLWPMWVKLAHLIWSCWETASIIAFYPWFIRSWHGKRNFSPIENFSLIRNSYNFYNPNIRRLQKNTQHLNLCCLYSNSHGANVKLPEILG